MPSGREQHWNSVYGARTEDALTWFEATPALSLELVRRFLRPGDAFIDVGGGVSRLVDALLDEGFGPLSILDVSGSALAACRERLGPRGRTVTWIHADVTEWQPDRTYAVWHDRAAFHFLTEFRDCAAYTRTMAGALPPEGVAIIATFADDGPEMCSGLSVARYSPDDLARQFESLVPAGFEMIDAKRHIHVTPKGNRQGFQYSVFRKAAQRE